jgi:hypothetical protein
MTAPVCQCGSPWFACQPSEAATVFEKHLGKLRPSPGADVPAVFWCFTCWPWRGT